MALDRAFQRRNALGRKDVRGVLAEREGFE
jgi:hypothetical protein